MHPHQRRQLHVVVRMRLQLIHEGVGQLNQQVHQLRTGLRAGVTRQPGDVSGSGANRSNALWPTLERLENRHQRPARRTQHATHHENTATADTTNATAATEQQQRRRLGCQRHWPAFHLPSQCKFHPRMQATMLYEVENFSARRCVAQSKDARARRLARACTAARPKIRWHT